MAKEGRSAPIAYASAVCLLAFLIAASWFIVDRQAKASYAEATARSHGLQIELASEAMATGFQKILRESSILASYSFPEFLEGKRSPSSMEELFRTERASYPEALVYAYFEKPMRARFTESAKAPIAEALTAASVEAWTKLEEMEGPLIMPGPAFSDEPCFMFFFAVRRGEDLDGLLGVAVSFNGMIEKYLLPLTQEEGRSLFLLTADGDILWAGEGSDRGLPGLPSLPAGMRRIERSFKVGDESFQNVEFDSAKALSGKFALADSLKILVLVLGLAAEALVIAGIFKLRAEEIRKRFLLKEEERLSQAVEERDRELAESELRFDLVFDTAFDAIFIMDEDGKVIRCNRRAGELFGCEPDLLIGTRPQDNAPERQADGRPSTEAAEDRIAECMKGRPIVFEWMSTKLDGSRFYSEVGLSVLHSEGKVFLIAMYRDNTERKKNDRALREALEDREILLRELHHRVKNNLQFMDSLIELQKRGEESAAAAALAKMQSRIAALSAAYFVIAESPEDFRIDSRRYFASLCSLLHDEAETRGVKIDIVLDCGDVPIDLDSAVPIGLIVRELVINSALHGYREGGGGKVEVSFLVAKNKAELRVRDYGAGMAPGAEDRLGLTVARALCLQLGGILEFEDASPGLSAATSFLLA